MSGNYIKPIANFDFGVDDLYSPEQKELYQYWLDKKGDRVMPSKVDFDPIDVPRILAFISMENVTHDPLRFEVRLTGSKTSSLEDSKGQFIDEINVTEEILIMLTQMGELKKPYIYTSKINWDKRKYKTYSSLVLPFSDDGINVNLSMSCHHTLKITEE